MLEFVICDVEEDGLTSSLNIVTKTLEKCNYSVLSFTNYDTNFMDYVKGNKKKVVYILGVTNLPFFGISIAKYIRKFDNDSIIIILTKDTLFDVDIYKDELNILTIISRNLEAADKVSLAVRASISYFMEKDDIVSFSDLATEYKIPAKDILYIVKNGRKTLIRTCKCDYEVYTSLDKMKRSLPRYFKQSHRACIINMRRISSLNCSKKIIYFDTGEYIDYIGDKYKKELIS